MSRFIFFGVLCSILLTSCGSNTTPATTHNTPSGTSVPSVEKTDTNIASIEQVKTLDDLKTMNPEVLNFREKNHPKFVEFQKNQMLLGVYLAKLQDPAYIKLTRELMDIAQWKTLWSEELQKTTEEVLDIASRMRQGAGGLSQSYVAAVVKRNALMKKLQTSEAFRAYLQKNKTKIEELNTKIKTYYTPEITELQKKIADLSKEIYSSSASGATK